MSVPISALAVTPTGSVFVVTTSVSDRDVLRMLYSVIGCRSVDLVRLADDVDMWLDDEGMLNGSPVNMLATYVATRFGQASQRYFGTAVFTGGAHGDGDTRPLGDQRAQEIRSLVTEMMDVVRAAVSEPDPPDDTGPPAQSS